jgi:uncharacterized protein YcnI
MRSGPRLGPGPDQRPDQRPDQGKAIGKAVGKAVGTVIGLVLALLAAAVGAAGPARAHVTVSAPDAVQGGYAVLTVRVPTESDTLRTVGLRLQLPADTPITSVRLQPKAGWKATMLTRPSSQPQPTSHGATTETTTEVVSEIDWTATGAGIGPGEFDEFKISAGPLPKIAVLTLKAVQVYSDGSEVGWVEVGQDGAEPDHPAPTIHLAPAGAPISSGGASAASTPAAGSGRGLAVTALVIAIGAVLLGGAALLRPRRSAPRAS